MIEEMLPAPVVAVESFVDIPDASLFPAEEAFVARAVAKRRNEFATVRHCARAALARLGVPPAAILPGERGAPVWPAGIVGSMTHCAGYRAAAVARAAAVRAIGIDAEPHEPLPDGVLDIISTPGERAELSSMDQEHSTVYWSRLLFSAKESIYKAWSPLTGRWLDFTAARVTIDPLAGVFGATLLAGDSPFGEIRGRWLVAGGLIVTAVVVLPERA